MLVPHCRPRAPAAARSGARLAACVVLVGVSLLAGCRGDAAEPDAALPVPPTAEEMARDLVGERFTFYEDEQGEKRWTIEDGEVRDFRIVDGVTAGDGASHRARVTLTLSATNRTIRGALMLTYRRSGGGWTLDDVMRPDGNWIVEELAAVVYEVRRPPPSDTTAGARDVWLEPMFRYVDGGYVGPFDDYDARIRALLDSSFAADSLRRDAVSGLEREISRRWLDPAWTVFLLAAGDAPAPVSFRTREAGVEGCRYVAGQTRAPSSGFAERARLATSSSTMGGATFPGRVLETREEDALAGLARARLAEAGVTPVRLERLRSRRSLAVDLDENGVEELIATFGIADDGAGGTERGVLVIAGSGTSTPRVMGARVSDAADGWGALQLVGALDVDGDGIREVVVREAGAEAYRYVVLARAAGGRWTEVFSGGGGCF
ncbi:MAG TPA: hypothetical protein VK610_09735 [Rhodothermales bacterium]|nr:hypothetical protein [Rhodothermales bacterium]